jgi:hypothetical protein
MKIFERPIILFITLLLVLFLLLSIWLLQDNGPWDSLIFMVCIFPIDLILLIILLLMIRKHSNNK